MTFTGWTARALDFYRGLEADNSRTYWLDHKDIYESAVLAPMNALLDELADEFGEGKVFRPYRDVRFSADKSLYKTAIGAVLKQGGYIQLSADGLAAGAGYHRMAPDQLVRYRQAVAGDRAGEALEASLADMEGHGIEIMVHDALKTVPRGFDTEHPRAELLRNKDLAAWTQWGEPPWLETAAARGHVVDFFHAAAPLTLWLDEYVGPTTQPRSR